MEYANGVGKSGVVVLVKPKPRKGVASKAIELLESAIVKFILRDPEQSCPLTGNFAPVDETNKPFTNLDVKGYLPECLDGEFLMVGPNPKFAPVAGYSSLDGDGMVHGIRIKQGKAVAFVSRYVRTSRFNQEDFHGGPVFGKFGDLKGMLGVVMHNITKLRICLKVIDISYGCSGSANAALEYHAGKLMVVGDKPYAIKVLENGDLRTIGMVDYDNGPGFTYTPHPKIDPSTGEMFTFGFLYGSPYLIIFQVISKDDIMQISVPITVSTSNVIMHDFAITESYAIFIDHPFKVMHMSLPSFDHTKKTHFGVLPRYARDEKSIKWFELPTCAIFYIANAWEEEEGNEVTLICCRKPFPDSSTSELYEMRFNMMNDLASQKRLSTSYISCPKINKNYTGRKQRYVYGMKRGGASPRRAGNVFSEIVKFDLKAAPELEHTKLGDGGNVIGRFEMGPSIFASEAIFVPKLDPDNKEDDGHLIFFCHDENTGKSALMVIDAKTMSPDPVAVVELPTRVPYGLHAFFMTEDQLREQHAACL